MKTAAKDLIFPILRDRDHIVIDKYVGIVNFIKISLAIILGIIILEVIFVLVRRHLVPRFTVQQEEEDFFVALARAYNLNEEELALTKRLAWKERTNEVPYEIFYSPKTFDPCFTKEIARIQKKRFWADDRKGLAIAQIYKIRRKIFV